MHLFYSKKADVERMFSRYGDTLYRLALVRLGHDADAQDVVQDVFTKYMTAKPVFENHDHEKAWFLRTAVNHCHDMIRRQKLRTHTPLEEALHLASDETSGVRELMALISQLPSIYADVVVLHSLEGYSIQETAELLEISPSAVKMRLSRAREMLKKLREE